MDEKIKIQEPRIGNVLKFERNDICFEVESLEITDNQVNRTDIAYMEPMPLNDSLLLKLGFKSGDEYVNTKGFWDKGDFRIVKCEWEEEDYSYHLQKTGNGELLYYRHGKIPVIKYIHQLQNIYFSITGRELDVDDIV